MHNAQLLRIQRHWRGARVRLTVLQRFINTVSSALDVVEVKRALVMGASRGVWVADAEGWVGR
jgi:hypothetical protein